MKIENPIVFDEGIINILSRTFELLPVDRQRMVYRDNQYKVHENTLSFIVEQDKKTEKLKLIPLFNITAHTVVEPAGDLPGDYVH